MKTKIISIMGVSLVILCLLVLSSPVNAYTTSYDLHEGQVLEPVTLSEANAACNDAGTYYNGDGYYQIGAYKYGDGWRLLIDPVSSPGSDVIIISSDDMGARRVSCYPNPEGTGTETVEYVYRGERPEVAPATVVNFTATPLTGSAPLSVTFTDTSINTPLTWQWYFGDGSTSTIQNPGHSYQNPGIYTVRLDATNMGGIGNHTEFNYIVATLANTENYTLTATPETITPGQNITVTLSAPSGNYTQIANLGIKCWPGTCTDISGRSPVYQLQGATWYQLDANAAFTINKGSTFPVTNLELTGLTVPGENEVKATIWESSRVVEATDTVTVSGTGSYHTITFEVVDEKYGATIHSAQVHLKSASTGVWQVRSLLDDSVEFQVQHGEYFSHYATAEGYLDSETTAAYANGNMALKTALRKIVDTPAGNTTLDVLVNRYGTTDGLEGVLVRMSDGTTKTTQYSGAVTFTLINNSAYDMTVSKTGYTTRIYHINTLGSQQAVSVFLFPVTVATPTPRVTDPITGNTITVVPTLDVRTNGQKGDSVVKIVYDNAESIVWALIILFFIGCVKMALKGWKFW